MQLIRWVALLHGLFLLACNTDRSVITYPLRDLLVNDTAPPLDTTIVAQAADQTENAGWKLQRVWTIGSQGQPEDYFFYGWLGIEEGVDGRIYVLSHSDRSVRVFTGDGEYLFSFGGDGAGPDEFRNPIGITLVEDTLVVVVDNVLRKLAVFGLGGTLIKTARLGWERLTDGLIATGEVRPVSADCIVIRTYYGITSRGLRVDGMSALYYVDLDGQILETVAEYFGVDAMVIPNKNRLMAPEAYTLPYPRGYYWDYSAALGRLVLANSGEYKIREYNERGMPVHLLQNKRPVRRATDRDWREYQDGFPNGVGRDHFPPDLLKDVEAALDRIERRDTWPAFDALLYDPHGNLWVRQPVASYDSVALWDVYDTDRRWRGTVQLPHRVSVGKLGRTAVYAISSDSLGIKYIEKFRIVH